MSDEPVRNGDPHGFGSHLPILEMVLALVKPKQVLELGAGHFSTPEFLRCPTVKQLTSLETDSEWVGRVNAAIVDVRFDLRKVQDTAKALPRLMDYDLVFVDNGQSVHERVAAIHAVLEQDHPVTVIHDAEYPDYRMAISQLTEDFLVFDAPLHQTAVCW